MDAGVLFGGIGGLLLAVGAGLLAAEIGGSPELGTLAFFLALFTVPGGITLGAALGAVLGGRKRPGERKHDGWSPTGKSRHVCLTIGLVLVLLWNSATAIAAIVGMMMRTNRNPNEWALPLLVLSLLNLACADALSRWKKWGFWGMCATSVVALVVALSVGGGAGPAPSGLLHVLVLYGLLQVGKENKGWPQLD